MIDEASPALAALVERRGQMVGVIDIGSNSLRLVIYDRLSRAPVTLFNEKVMCALGRGLNATGRLNRDGVKLARENIVRFVALARRLGVGRLDALATSAVRDARDGADFVAEIEALCGQRIIIVDGEREGLLSAAGVRAGIPEADGLTGDLGGGSLEIAVTGRPGGPSVSLPIGPLRFLGSGQELQAARAAIDQQLDRVGFLAMGTAKPFYAVGGTWRALARVHMDYLSYPLHIIHHYTLTRAQAEGFLGLIEQQSPKSLEKMGGVSRRRLESLPLAAHVLGRVVRLVAPSALVFSTFGLREGHLFDLLDEAAQAQDPLIVAVTDMARGNLRFGEAGDELTRWVAPLFPHADPAERRLTLAAAILSDLAWSEHPDYRAEHSFERCLRMPVPGLDHRGRAFIAAIMHARYGGEADAAEIGPIRPLLDEAAWGRARAIGAAFRLAYTLTGGAPGMLGDTAIALDEIAVRLTIPNGTALLPGDVVQRRLDTVGRALGRRGVIAVD